MHFLKYTFSGVSGVHSSSVAIVLDGEKLVVGFVGGTRGDVGDGLHDVYVFGETVVEGEVVASGGWDDGVVEG